MLGIGDIEIEKADYNIGMSGSITIRINKTGKRYHVRHTMQGQTMSEMVWEGEDEEWTSPKETTLEEFVQLLPKNRGWTVDTFIFVWAGFAAGYEK